MLPLSANKKNCNNHCNNNAKTTIIIKNVNRKRQRNEESSVFIDNKVANDDKNVETHQK